MSKKIQILIVDDHPLYRVGLKMTLRYSGINCEVIAETENVLQTTEYLKEHGQEPDLMMLDYFLSDGTAKDVVTVAEACCPKLKILLLSGEVMHPTVMQLAEKHIDGFISKTVKPDELKLRIEALFPDNEDEEDNDSTNPIDGLTSRELEIIRLCAAGKSASEIAKALFISKRTVESHKDRIFNKLNLKSTAEIIQYAFRKGLIE